VWDGATGAEGAQSARAGCGCLRAAQASELTVI